MGCSFFTVFVYFCVFFRFISSNQPEISGRCDHYKFTKEMIKFNEKIDYLMSAMEKLEENDLKTEINNSKEKESKMEEEIKKLNKKIEQMGQIFNQTQVENKNNLLIMKEIQANFQIWIDNNPCAVTDASQMFNLSPLTLVHTWTGLNSSMSVKNERASRYGEVFSLPQHGLTAQLRFFILADGYVETDQRFFAKNSSHMVKILPRLTCAFKVHRNGHIMHTYIGLNEFDFSPSLGYFGFLTRFNYSTNKTESKNDEDESYSLEVHVDTPEMSNRWYADNGTVKGSICPYNKIREWRSKGIFQWIYSPHFYTSPKGGDRVFSRERK